MQRARVHRKMKVLQFLNSRCQQEDPTTHRQMWDTISPWCFHVSNKNDATVQTKTLFSGTFEFRRRRRQPDVHTRVSVKTSNTPIGERTNLLREPSDHALRAQSKSAKIFALPCVQLIFWMVWAVATKLMLIVQHTLTSFPMELW